MVWSLRTIVLFGLDLQNAGSIGLVYQGHSYLHISSALCLSGDSLQWFPFHNPISIALVDITRGSYTHEGAIWLNPQVFYRSLWSLGRSSYIPTDFKFYTTEDLALYRCHQRWAHKSSRIAVVTSITLKSIGIPFKVARAWQASRLCLWNFHFQGLTSWVYDEQRPQISEMSSW